MIETPNGVAFSPEHIVKRQSASWRGMSAEIVQLTRLEPFEYRLRAPCHLLIASHLAERRDGETLVEGLPRSTRREFSRRLTFVPAGGEFYGWQEPRALTRVSYFYIDPKGPLLDHELRFDELQLAPRLFFEDAALWTTATKLTQEIERGVEADRFYLEALSLVLGAELARLNRVDLGSTEQSRGGLAAWQRRSVDELIETRLAEPIHWLRSLTPYGSARGTSRARSRSRSASRRTTTISRGALSGRKSCSARGRCRLPRSLSHWALPTRAHFRPPFGVWWEASHATTAALLCNANTAGTLRVREQNLAVRPYWKCPFEVEPG